MLAAVISQPVPILTEFIYLQGGFSMMHRWLQLESPTKQMH